MIPKKGWGETMRMYYFDATVRVQHDGRPLDAVIHKGARAEDELAARRLILDHFFESGFQVLKLRRVDQRKPEASGGL
jgi:hypothetical protein